MRNQGNLRKIQGNRDIRNKRNQGKTKEIQGKIKEFGDFKIM